MPCSYHRKILYQLLHQGTFQLFFEVWNTTSGPLIQFHSFMGQGREGNSSLSTPCCNFYPICVIVRPHMSHKTDDLATEYLRLATVSMSKGIGEYQGIRLIKVMWKVISVIIDLHLANSIKFHDILHCLWSKIGTGTAVGRQLKVPSILFLWFYVSSRVLNHIHTWINLLKKSSKLQIRLQPKVHYENRTAAEFGPFLKIRFSCL